MFPFDDVIMNLLLIYHIIVIVYHLVNDALIYDILFYVLFNDAFIYRLL